MQSKRTNIYASMKKGRTKLFVLFVLALPIFPVRLQTSIFGRSELNFRVRNGNGWTLALINTNYCNCFRSNKLNCNRNTSLCQVFLSHTHSLLSGDPYGNRTHVCGVRGRRLNRLTNGPDGAPSRIRTGDPLIKSQLLYQLS